MNSIKLPTTKRCTQGSLKESKKYNFDPNVLLSSIVNVTSLSEEAVLKPRLAFQGYLCSIYRGTSQLMLKSKKSLNLEGGGSIAQWLASMFDSRRSQKFSIAEINQWRWLVESGHWLENIDRTHLVLVSGKPVLQKIESP